MKEIPLTQGKVALVDDEDYDYISQWKWCVTTGRAVRNNGTTVFMHRVIMKTPAGMEVDHIDGNSLNNQKSNLRNCSHNNNQKNMRISYKKYKGITYVGNVSGYKARLYCNGERIHLGFFKTEEEAALAYNEAAIKYFGEFANLNIIRKEANDDAQTG